LPGIEENKRNKFYKTETRKTAAIWASRFQDATARAQFLSQAAGSPAVPPRPLGRLTSVFEMGTGVPSRFGRLIIRLADWYLKFTPAKGPLLK